MESLAVLGLAANIIQFVDFTSKLFSQSTAIYRSINGVSEETQEMITIATGLQTLCARLTSTPSTNSAGYPMDDELKSLAQQCKAAGDQLVAALHSLKATGTHRKWASFTTALASVWKQSKIEAMKKKLETYKSQLSLQLTRQTQAMLQYASIYSTELAHQPQGQNPIKTRKKMKDNTTPEHSSISASCTHPPEPLDITVEASKLLEIEERGNKTVSSLIILRSLCFPTMRFRHSKIADAHPETFRWIASTYFIPWLQADDDAIFWISGKPGSGKSTLMKYLVDDRETTANLRLWSGTKELAMASFFFWIAGTDLQKSQEGLLQSLLYQVLRKHPDLVPKIFPSRWEEDTLHDESETNIPWTRQELLGAFRRLKEHRISSTKFCFFIDGLDEYEGDHQDLITVLKSLVNSSNVKICASSRPWNVFEEAFGADPIRKVYLQDVNRDDIRTYVHTNLVQRPEFQKLIERDPRGEEIAREVVDKAQGVFLWVFLVVRSLVEGLQNSDRIIDLQRRLRQFPSDLEAFFMHIFTSLDSIYQAQTARAFQVAIATTEPLAPKIYWFLDMEEEDPDFALKMEQIPESSAELHFRTTEIQKRLNGRCKGLLEITADEELELPFLKRDDVKRVDFLHRTVKDFLMSKDMQTLLSSWAGTTFDANIAICKTLLAQI
ncbi:uncharacterized protein BDZ99DRAFT_337271, partial [Mytilinidion resinicola]